MSSSVFLGASHAARRVALLRHALPPARIGSAAYIRFLESAPTAALSEGQAIRLGR